MNLHSKGQEDFIKELTMQQQSKIKAVNESDIPMDKKDSLIRKIKARFSRLIKDTDQSLFFNET